MSILVTGAAGYIGSILTEELIKEGYTVVAVDNLTKGHQEAVAPQAIFVQADLADTSALNQIFIDNNIDAVMHLAANSLVGESVTNPALYFRTNTLYGMNLLDAMHRHKVSELIFSSTAAVYGEPERTPIREDNQTTPANPYGESKLMFEKILKWYGAAYGLKHISLRYFNAAGASELLGEDHHPETHLIPNILKAALNKDKPVSIFGTDYPTKDGSCVRDYVHVTDIARAHILALRKIDALSGGAYNLGNGKGFSVLEVVRVAKKITGTDMQVKLSPKRAGDPATLVASADKVGRELGWSAQHPELEVIIESAWQWARKHPRGYERPLLNNGKQE